MANELWIGASLLATIVDQKWGRSLYVRAPDRTIVQIDKQDRELYT